VKTRTIIFFAVFAVAVSLSFWVGYKHGQYHWDGSPRPAGVTLAKILRQRGVSRESVAYLRFIGDENSYTAGRVATNTTDVAWIWDRMIETAEPYAFWESSGWRRVEIYTHDRPQPIVVLCVNATDATCIAGDNRSFMCHGLHDVALRFLSGQQMAKNP